MLNTKEFNDVIKEETRTTFIISLALLSSVVVYFLISLYVLPTIKVNVNTKVAEQFYQIINIVAVVEIIIVLAIRRTIYFSSKFIKNEMKLREILQKWRIIDIVLLSIAESISIYGVVSILLGLPMNRVFHFFVASALVILIIMPMNWKVRDKLRTLQKYRVIEL